MERANNVCAVVTRVSLLERCHYGVGAANLPRAEQNETNREHAGARQGSRFSLGITFHRAPRFNAALPAKNTFLTQGAMSGEIFFLENRLQCRRIKMFQGHGSPPLRSSNGLGIYPSVQQLGQTVIRLPAGRPQWTGAFVQHLP